MESWRIVFRAFAEQFLARTDVDARGGLAAMADMLRADDPRLVQGATTTPPPLMCVQDWPLEAGDFWGVLAARCGAGKPVPHPDPAVAWKTTTVGEAEEFFARTCFDVDQKVGEAAACRWFLNWFDDTPRHRMRAELLPEVEFALDPTRPDPFAAREQAAMPPAAAPKPTTPF